MESLNFPPVDFYRLSGNDTIETVFPEFVIVARNIVHFEKIPTVKWLSLLQEKSLIRQKQNRREADRLHNLAAQLTENDELNKAMILITQALYRCPADDTLAKAILCQKGELLRRHERVQDAIRHLEMCLKIEGDRFSFGAYLCLLRCHKATGNARKVQSTLERCSAFLNRWKEEFQRYDSQLKNEPDRHMENMKKEFDLHADCIPQEMFNDKCFRIEPAVQDNYVEEIDFEPFMGYTDDKKIGGASKACSLNINGEGPQLVANTYIPEGSIVLVERPLATHLEFSKVQCYTCHLVQPHLIPCFHCQAVFYCSYQCQRQDAGYHRYECLGHKLLFFPLVNGNLEIRMLIRTLNTLKRVMAVKSSSNYESPRTAEELFEVLLKGREAFADLFSVLLVKFSYDKFRAEDFDALIIKTEKLLSYVKFDLNMKVLYEQLKHFDDRQFDIFVGGLLLHFCTLTMTKVHRLSYEIPATEEFVGRMEEFTPIEDDFKEEPLRRIILDSLERYGSETSSILRASINTDMLREGVLQHLEVLGDEIARSKISIDESTSDNDCVSVTRLWTRANVKRLWNMCLDGAGMNAVQRTSFLNHQRERAEDVVDKALLRFFDSYFDYFEEIPMCSRSLCFQNTLRTFYSTAMNIKHSCQPNLFFAMISNGLLVVRARCDISKGETLTLNHGPHFKDAPREKRREYLRKIYINCDCLECSQIEDHWTRHQRVKCENCLFNTEAPHTCPQCLQVREQSAAMEQLIQQLQSIEADLSQSQLPQLIPLSTIAQAAENVQTTTVSGKRKVELLMFFERIWLMLFVDATNVPLYNNLKEQLSCFADEVFLDSIDGVYVLLKRCKAIIDTLFPERSVTVASEYEQIVRRVVKYLLPANVLFFRFIGLDMRQVHRTIDLTKLMIRDAFTILDEHFLCDDDCYHKLMVVEDRLIRFESNIRSTEAHDESELFLTLMGALKQTKSPCDAHGNHNCDVSSDCAKAQISNSPPKGDGSCCKTDKSNKRKETGAIPKPCRTTRHHRKV